MADPLTTFQDDLNTLATADTTNPQGGTATPTTALTAAQEVLSLLADQTLVGSGIGAAVSGVYTTIATKITDDVVKALQAIAGELRTNANLANLSIKDATSALSALQNALQTAQSLVPGGSSAVASAFASTTQFATLFANLLQDAGSVAKAADTLDEVAQQLDAVANAFKTAASGNP
jgi:hypothetical protein